MEPGAHYEADIFVANPVPHGALTKMYVANTLKEQLANFKRDIDEFNREESEDLFKELFKRDTGAGPEEGGLRVIPHAEALQKNIDEFNHIHSKDLHQNIDQETLADPTKWDALTKIPQVLAMKEFLEAHAGGVLESLTSTMCTLVPKARRDMKKQDIVDIGLTAKADADPNLMLVAGELHLVAAIIETIQALFSTPAALFGKPKMFFGEEVEPFITASLLHYELPSHRCAQLPDRSFC